MTDSLKHIHISAEKFGSAYGCAGCGKLIEFTPKPTEDTEELEIRSLINNLFQDVDTETNIETDTANAICEVHTQKFLSYILHREKQVKAETAEKICTLIDYLEAAEGSTSTEMWRYNKAIRNAIRDRYVLKEEL